MPPPPTASLRGRITLAAAAAGAAVAGGQTLVNVLDEPPVVAAALLPVADTRDTADNGTDAGLAGQDPIGQDQLTGAPLRVGPLGGNLGPDLDPRSAVDVQNLTKATDIGQQIAKRTAILRSALAEGAPEAEVFGGQAFVRPALGRLTSLFGARWGVTHYGIDIANGIGTPIYALTDGVVAEAGPASGFGLWVVIKHPDGTSTVYGHVNQFYVHQGQQVHAGEHIADIGNRGFSTGPHLHLEVWAPDGTKINPIPWLARHGLTIT